MKQIFVGISMVAVMATATTVQADLTIGVNLSSTGPAATLGIAEKNAVSLGPAVIAGQKVRYVVYDDATDTTIAVQNVKRLISENKVDFIIGPTTSPAGLAVVSVAAAGKTALIQLAPSPAPIAPGDEKRKWIFYGHTAAEVNANAMVEHMVAHGVKRVSVISLDDAYGETCVEAYKKIAAQNGIKTLTFEKYKRSDTSATGQVLHAMAGNPDAVYIASSGTPGALPHVSLVERGYKGKIYQSGGSASAEFLRLGGKALEGSYMMGPPLLVAEQLPSDFPAKKEALAFVKAYESKFGPRSMFAAQVWNAMALLEATVPKALKAGKPGTEKFRVALRDAIENTHGLKGAGIVISFSPTDHTGISKTAMCVLKIEGGKWKLDQHAAYK